MAYMFPEKPKEFAPNSQEGVMFEALAILPDSYYVFHSFSIVNVVDGIVHESETDFVIFYSDKGLLCLVLNMKVYNHVDEKRMRDEMGKLDAVQNVSKDAGNANNSKAFKVS